MKKTIALILSIVLCLSLCACGGSNDTPETKNDEKISTPAESQLPTTNGTETMRPEFKEAMDAYEAFYDEYCEFMEEYKKNPSDMTLLPKYTEMLEKVAEMNEAFETWDEDELSDAELKYYLDVTNRVMEKMADIAG